MINMNRSELLLELMGEEIDEEFLYKIMDETVKLEIESFIVARLTKLRIYLSSSDIEVQMLTETLSFNIVISEELEKRLSYFEKLNPEYFI